MSDLHITEDLKISWETLEVLCVQGVPKNISELEEICMVEWAKFPKSGKEGVLSATKCV